MNGMEWNVLTAKVGHVHHSITTHLPCAYGT
jgi:hypothetical protein